MKYKGVGKSHGAYACLKGGDDTIVPSDFSWGTLPLRPRGVDDGSVGESF